MKRSSSWLGEQLKGGLWYCLRQFFANTQCLDFNSRHRWTRRRLMDSSRRRRATPNFSSTGPTFSLPRLSKVRLTDQLFSFSLTLSTSPFSQLSWNEYLRGLESYISVWDLTIYMHPSLTACLWSVIAPVHGLKTIPDVLHTNSTHSGYDYMDWEYTLYITLRNR